MLIEVEVIQAKKHQESLEAERSKKGFSLNLFEGLDPG